MERNANNDNGHHRGPRSSIAMDQNDKNETKPSTVEDRVRARALAKRQKQQQEQEDADSHADRLTTTTKEFKRSRKSPPTQACDIQDEKASSSVPSVSFPLQELWPWANLLWLHARSIQNRAALGRTKHRLLASTTQYFSSQQQSKEEPVAKFTMVTLTWRDAVQLFQQQPHLQVTVKNNAPNNRPQKPFGKKLAAQYLRQVVHLVPEWLHLTTSSNTKDPQASHNSSSSTTLWMFHSERYNKTLDHAWLRQRFFPSEEMVAEKTKKPISVVASYKDGIQHPKRALSFSTNANAKHVTRNIDMTDTKDSLSAAFSTNVAATTTNSTSLQQGSDNHNDKNSVEPNAPTQDAKPAAPTTRNSPSPRRSPKRVRSSATALRINPHLILSDADHSGGDRLVPQMYDSPRGLRGLFQQMKQGGRI